MWIKLLGDGPKNQLKSMITALTNMLAMYKAFWLLVNSDFEDIYKKKGMEYILKIYQQFTVPIEAELKILNKYTAPFADCPPVATVNQVSKSLVNIVIGTIQDFEFIIQQYIDAIEINQAKAEALDNMIEFLNNISDAIDQCP